MKVLIVKTSAFGDIIQTYPVVSYLRQNFPEAEIDWVVELRSKELVENHPEIRRTLPIDTKQWRKDLFQLKKSGLNTFKSFRKALREEDYDVVFDLQGNVKSGLVTSQARSKSKVGFGLNTAPEWPNVLFSNRRYNPLKGLNIREDYLHLVHSYFAETQENVLQRDLEEKKTFLLNLSLQQQAHLFQIMQEPLLQGRQKVMVCVGSAWRNKQMTLEAMTLFLAKVHTFLNCAFVFVWGTSEEQQMAKHLQERFSKDAVLLEKLQLAPLQNLMTQMDLIIAMDSLPLHLAGTTATPTFSIFGASSGHKYNPVGLKNHFFQGSCPYNHTFEKRCPLLRTCHTGACIRSLTGEEVFESLRNFL